MYIRTTYTAMYYYKQSIKWCSIL